LHTLSTGESRECRGDVIIVCILDIDVEDFILDVGRGYRSSGVGCRRLCGERKRRGCREPGANIRSHKIVCDLEAGYVVEYKVQSRCTWL